MTDVATAAPVFSARGLTKTYGEGATAVHLLRGVDLDVQRGEFIVLLGASGSGKSTLLNILGGLDSADGGSARWRDHDLVRAGDAELTAYRREHVGFVFQFYNLIPSLTARENVALVTDLVDEPMTPEEALALRSCCTPRRTSLKDSGCARAETRPHRPVDARQANRRRR
jgi:putative ABC transport system ATP-binding protein